MTPPETRRRLADMASRWPIGAAVRHELYGWTARVTTAPAGQAPGHTLTAEAAHTVTGIVGAVHVEPDQGFGQPPMWMNERYLSLVSTAAAPVPAPPRPATALRTATTRTRRRAR